MRKLASIQTISDIMSIKDADLICAYKVQGWWVVGRKGEFKLGDKVVFIEIDSWVPHDLAPFLTRNRIKTYNGVPGNKLKTIRLKGQLSQGLLLSIATCVEYVNKTYNEESDALWNSLPIETDVTDALGIQKWEPSVDLGSGQPRGNFPSFIPKTDEVRVQNLKHFDYGECFITEKLEGSSMTVYFKDGNMGVCSRNIDLIESDDCRFWNTAKKLGLVDKLRDYCEERNINLAVQGELVGPGVQGNYYGLSEHDFYIFNVYDIDHSQYLSFSWTLALSEYLDVKSVPVVGYYNGVIDGGLDADICLEIADGLSVVNNSKLREGVVYKSKNLKGSFKAISNRYLLHTS